MGDLDESPLRDQSPVADELAEEIAVLRIDEKETECKEDAHKSDNVDKTDDNEIKMAVKIRNRTPSSIDTDYQDLINKYGNEEYLSKIDITSDKAAEDEEARSFHSVDGERPYIGSKLDKEDEGDVLDTSNSTNEEEHDRRQDYKVGIEFWRGYGCNIYFQPMTCHTLPLKKVKAKKGNSQMMRFQRRLSQKKRNTSSKMSYRMDVPTVKEAASNVGTLKLDDIDFISCSNNNSAHFETTRRVRVGNFVMSKELQKKVCKGFVCRNFDKFSREFLKNQNQTSVANERDVDNVKIKKVIGFVRPSRRKERAIKYIEQQAQKGAEGGESTHREEGKHKGVRVESVDSTEDDIRALPKLNSKPRYPESRPYKKTVAGKTLHLTTSLRTIKRVDLLPFQGPHDKRSAKEIKEIALERPLNTTPTQNEEGLERNESPDEKLVTDHLQEIQKQGTTGLVGGKDVNIEEKYAYESALVYYKNKMDKDVGAVLSTTSLLAKQNDTHRPQNKISGKGADVKLAMKNDNLPKKVPIEEVHIIGRSSLPNDFSSSFDEDAFSSKKSNAKKIALKLPGLQNTLHDEENYNGFTRGEGAHHYVTPLDSYIPSENGKAVRFDMGGNATWSLDSLDNYETSFALDTASAKLLDRYEVPTTKECRLPIIGQKIQTNSSS